MVRTLGGCFFIFHIVRILHTLPSSQVYVLKANSCYTARRNYFSVSTAHRTNEKISLRAARQRFTNLIRTLENSASEGKNRNKLISSFLPSRPEAPFGRANFYASVEENCFRELGLNLLRDESHSCYAEGNADCLSSATAYSCKNADNLPSVDYLPGKMFKKNNKFFASHVIESGIKGRISIKELMERFTKLPWTTIHRLNKKADDKSTGNLNFGESPADIALMLSQLHPEALLQLVQYATKCWVEGTDVFSSPYVAANNARNLDVTTSEKQEPSEISASVLFRSLEEDIFATYKTYLLQPLYLILLPLFDISYSKESAPRNFEEHSFSSLTASKVALLESVLLLCRTLTETSPLFSPISSLSNSFRSDRCLSSTSAGGMVEAAQWTFLFFMMYLDGISFEWGRNENLSSSTKPQEIIAKERCASHSTNEEIHRCFGLFRSLLEAMNGKEAIFMEWKDFVVGVAPLEHFFGTQGRSCLRGHQSFFSVKNFPDAQFHPFFLFTQLLDWCNDKATDFHSSPSMHNPLTVNLPIGESKTWNALLSSSVLSQQILSLIGPLARTLSDDSHSASGSLSLVFYRDVKRVWEILLVRTDIGHSEDARFFCQDSLHGLLTGLIRCYESKVGLFNNSISATGLSREFDDNCFLPFTLDVSDSETLVAELEDLIRIYRENTSWVALPTSPFPVKCTVPSNHRAGKFFGVSRMCCLTANNRSNFSPAAKRLSQWSHLADSKGFTTAVYHVLMKGFALCGRSDISFLLLNRLRSPSTRSSFRSDLSCEWLLFLLRSPNSRNCSPSSILFGSQEALGVNEVNYNLMGNVQVKQQLSYSNTLLRSYENTLWTRIQSFDAQGFFSSLSPFVKADYFHIISTFLLILRERNTCLENLQKNDKSEVDVELKSGENQVVYDCQFESNNSQMKRVYYLLSSCSRSVFQLHDFCKTLPSVTEVSVYSDRTLFLQLLALHTQIRERLIVLFANPSKKNDPRAENDAENLLKCLLSWIAPRLSSSCAGIGHSKSHLPGQDNTRIVPFPIIHLCSEIYFQLLDFHFFYREEGEDTCNWKKLLSWFYDTISKWCQWIVFSEISPATKAGKFLRRLQFFELPLFLPTPTKMRDKKLLQEKCLEQGCEKKQLYKGATMIGLQFPFILCKEFPFNFLERTSFFSARNLTTIKTLKDIECFVKGIYLQLEKASKIVRGNEKLDLSTDATLSTSGTTFFIISMNDFIELLILREVWVESLLSFFNSGSTSTSTLSEESSKGSSPLFDELSMIEIWDVLLGLPVQCQSYSGATMESSTSFSNRERSWSLLVAPPIEWEKYFGNIKREKNSGVQLKNREKTPKSESIVMVSANKINLAAGDSFDEMQKDQGKVLMLRDASALKNTSDLEFFESEFVSTTSRKLFPVNSNNFCSESRKRNVLSWLQDWAHQCVPFGEDEPFFSSSPSASAISPSSTYIKWNHKTFYSKQLNSLLFQQSSSSKLSRGTTSISKATQKDSRYCINLSTPSKEEEWDVLDAYTKELSEFRELTCGHSREQ